MHRHLSILLAFALAAPLALAQLPGDDILFPAGAKVVDATKPPFNAKGDGKTDDTAALRAALKHTGIIYLPAGTYLISDTLRWGANQSRTILQGQHRDKTIILLKDRSPGFGNSAELKPVLWTGLAPAKRYRNGIRDLTISVGAFNPGATAVQFIANQQGGIRDVRLQASPGSGAVGLDLGYTGENGPLLVQRLAVYGFETGILTKHGSCSLTFDEIELKEQRRIGFLNEGQFVSVRKLKSYNAVTAFANRAAGDGYATLLDVECFGFGPAAGIPAIENRDTLFVRNLTLSGYNTAIEDHGKPASSEPAITEWQSHGPVSLFPGGATSSLNLAVPETPRIAWHPTAEWASVLAFAKEGEKDLGPALQRAIDSGKPVVYFPCGSHQASGVIYLRGNLRRLIGLDAEFKNDAALSFVIQGEETAPLIVERFDCLSALLSIRHESKRPLILSSVAGGRVADVIKAAGSGDLFIEDVFAGPLRCQGGNTYALQLAAGAPGPEPRVILSNATLSAFGIKGSGNSTFFQLEQQSNAEILGCFIYADSAEKKAPFFVSNNSRFCFGAGEFVTRGAPFEQFVIETRGDETKTLKRGDLPARNFGSQTTLFVGY